MTDRAFIAFLQNCEDLSFLEISHLGSRYDKSLVGTLFDTLREEPELASKLKTLRVPQQDDKWFMKAMRDLVSERKSLLIQLVHVVEVYRDEKELWGQDYVKGRKRGDDNQVDRWAKEPLDPNVFHQNWSSRKKYNF